QLVGNQYPKGIPLEVFLSSSVEGDKYKIMIDEVKYEDLVPEGPSLGDKITFHVRYVTIEGEKPTTEKFTFIDICEGNNKWSYRLVSDGNEIPHSDKSVLKKHHFYRAVISELMRVNMLGKK
ncbi:hypothetical protein KY339_00685, partial [Candidatus Woesearchaeota archaeon]|nr:hypothetical protein [Candidatus Woesearchaeota archaeon]